VPSQRARRHPNSHPNSLARDKLPRSAFARERRLVGNISVDDRLGLISSLEVVRLCRAYVVLVVRSIAKRRINHVDLQSGISSVDHRGAVYGLSAPSVMLLT
jgi:hypothetical protein